jgi:predicted ATPase
MRSHAFVGREDALAFLRERYYKARCGDGGGVILSGEPGIGKSRLCDEFRRTVAQGDAA